MKSFRLRLFFLFFTVGTSVHGNTWRPRSLVEKVTGHPQSLEGVTPITTAISSRGGGNGNDKEDGKSTIAASVFNLVNNIAGAGILTLSAGMAAGTGWIPAIIICAFLGTISSHCFAIIGEACELTGEKDFKVPFFLIGW